MGRGKGWQDKADFSSSQKCRYVFVCTSFFRETLCLCAWPAQRLRGRFDARNGRVSPFVRETLLPCSLLAHILSGGRGREPV